MDISMPEQDGIETTKNLIQLFEENNDKNTIIIGCSGY